MGKECAFGFAHPVGEGDRAGEAAFRFGNEPNRCAETFDQVDPLLAHPVGHEYRDRIAQVGPNRSKSDACVAAGRLRNRHAFSYGACFVRLAENVAGDAVFDAAGVIVVFRLRVYDPRFAFVKQGNFQHWGVADQSRQTIKFFGHFFIYRHGQKTSHSYVMSFFAFILTLLPRKGHRQPIHKKYKTIF